MADTDPDVATQLERLSQLINEPLVASRLPEDYYELITANLVQIREEGPEAIDSATLDSLLSLVDDYESMLARYSSQPAVFNAAQSGDLGAVAESLHDGFDIDATDADGRTLLMIAAKGGYADLAKLLLSRGADAGATCKEDNDLDAAIFACEGGHEETARALLDHGVDVNAAYAPGSSLGPIGNQSLLGVAANRGHLDVCRLLIERGANLEVVSDSGYTPLMWALASNSGAEAAALLLDAGANPEPDTKPTEVFAAAAVTPLIMAIRAGMTDIALRLIEARVDVNSQDGSGCTALKEASRAGLDPIVDALIAAGADLNLADDDGWTPLISAASRAAWSTMELLIDAGADVTLVGDENVTALKEVGGRRVLRHGIVSLSRMLGRAIDPVEEERYDKALEIAEKLLEAGADPNVSFDDGKTLIDSVDSDEEFFELLMRFGAVPSERTDDEDEDEDEADEPELSDGQRLVMAAAKIDIDTLTALLDEGADIDHLDGDGDTALSYSVIMLCCGDPGPEQTRDLLEQIDLLISRGARIDTPGSRAAPLPMVARQGRLGLVNAMLAAGADPDATLTEIDPDAGKTALDVAREAGHDDTVAALMAAVQPHGSAEEAEGLWLRALVQAVAQKDQDRLRNLVNGRAFASLSVDSRLLAACALGDAKIAREMLQAGADPNHPCEEGLGGMTPLVMAVGASRSVEVASLLIDAGANVNDEWTEDTTPIFETTADQFYELAELLIARGANVNVRLDTGLTPLISAARNGASKCVDLFLDAGAEIDAVESEHGIGAFGWAVNRLDLKLAEKLLARGARPNFGSIDTLPLAIAEHGSMTFIAALDERGCNLVRSDQRARVAFIAAKNPDPEVFDYILSRGADPTDGNDLGYTPLILAALNNRPTLIRRFLERGADASARDMDGETALSLAIEKRHHEAIEALREFHVEEGDYSADAPEHAIVRATTDGALGTVLNLRDSGISINSGDGEGNSLLMLAAKAGHLGVLRSLYHLGADINHRNHHGETALSLAKASEATDIVNSLQEFGALHGMSQELGALSNLFGGISMFNAADTMFGRMSHPFKDKPPYDNETADDEDGPNASEDDQDDPDIDESDEGRSDESGVGASIDSKLDLLGQALDSDQVKDQLPEAMLEQLTQKLDHWRSLHEGSELDGDELAELSRLLDLFGLGEKEDAEEVERTPLFEAVHAKDLAAVRKIIKGGGDVNEVDGEGYTPLFVAVLTRQAKLVDELLKLGADPNKSRPDGKGPLFGAVRVTEEKITQTLLKGGAQVDAPMSLDHNGIEVGGCTALYVAALLGHLPSCKALASSGASLEAANDLGYTPLMAAIEGDHEEVIDYLLKSGANVNPAVIATMEVEGLGGASPLYTATRKENLAVIKKLLKRGVDVNRPTPNGWTPLKSAAQQGCLEIVKALLEAGADPNIADGTNYTPLMNAVSGEHEDIVKVLLKFNADPNAQGGDVPDDDEWQAGRTALMDAAVSGNVAIARELLKQGADPNLLNATGCTALHSAVISASTDMVSLLLKSGADPDVCGNEEEKMSAVALALRRWASEDEDEREGGVSDVLELMLKEGMPSDRAFLNETALDLVAEGRREVVDLLAKQGFAVDANYSKDGSNKLLTLAAIGDFQLEEGKRLLDIGADANYKSVYGLPVLSMAVRSGALRFAEMLLNAGANVMGRNVANALAYDLAVIYGHGEIMDLLIEHMNQVVPPVDRQADDGTTALMRAAMAGDMKAVKDLLAAGADASRRNRQGDSPLSYAMTQDLEEVVQALRAAGVERLSEDKVIGHESIVLAGDQGALGTILDLLDSGVPIDTTDSDGNTALTAGEAHPGVIKVLAKLGANLSHRNGEGKTAYMMAAAMNRTRVMRVLEDVGSPIEAPDELDGFVQQQAMLKKALRAMASLNGGADESDGNADIEADGDLLVVACLGGDALTVSKQIAAGVDVNYQNEEGRTALMMALVGLCGGDLSRRKERALEQVIDSLLVAGADPNKGPVPPLIIATTTGRLHLVNALIRAGADVNVPAELPTDDPDETMFANCLVVALAQSETGAHHPERVGMALVRAGVDLAFTSNDGSMAIHSASKAGMTNILREILDRAPEGIDAQDNEGSTPLMAAAASDRVEAIKLLLERQANRDVRDAKGRTAAEIAAEAGHQDALAALADG